jgi:hypothetical protein
VLDFRLTKKSGGHMPVLKKTDGEEVVSGLSDVISFIEDEFPEPALGKMQADEFDV